MPRPSAKGGRAGHAAVAAVTPGSRAELPTACPSGAWHPPTLVTPEFEDGLSCGVPTALQSLAAIERAVSECERCPELRTYCAEIGRTKRRAYADWDYWAKPVPSFGDFDIETVRESDYFFA